jgi:hypothetical protein
MRNLNKAPNNLKSRHLKRQPKFKLHFNKNIWCSLEFESCAGLRQRDGGAA